MHLLIVILGSVAALGVAGVAYQAIGSLLDLRKVKDYGRMIDMGDGKVVFASMQGRGGPTVVFESGVSASSLHWHSLQQEVSKTNRTFAYDRLGLGWSSAATSERVPSRLACELHRALKNAGVPGPYVIVAHSFGALIAQQFAGMYSAETCGLFLLDPMRVEEWAGPASGRKRVLINGQRLMRRTLPLAHLGLVRVAAKSLLMQSNFFSHALGAIIGKGGRRLVDRSTRELAKIPGPTQRMIVEQWSSPAFYRGAGMYIRDVPRSVLEMHSVPPLVGTPITVLTPAGKPSFVGEGARPIGDNVRCVDVQGSGHWIHLDQPTQVYVEVRSLLDTLQYQRYEEEFALAEPRQAEQQPVATRYVQGVFRMEDSLQ